MTELITAPLGAMLLILFLIAVLLCFNAFTFYKWFALIEEYDSLKNQFDDYKVSVRENKMAEQYISKNWSKYKLKG